MKIKDLPIDPKTGGLDYSKDYFGKRCCLTVSGQLNVETHGTFFEDMEYNCLVIIYILVIIIRMLRAAFVYNNIFITLIVYYLIITFAVTYIILPFYSILFYAFYSI